MSVAPDPFRAAMRRFATGVTLVTAEGGGSLIVSSFTSVSLRPPLIAFCVDPSSLTWQRMGRARPLSVHVLGAGVRDVRERARPGADRLRGLDLDRDALATLACAPAAEHAAGDHTIVVCRVLAVQVNETADPDPLVFFGGDFGTFLSAQYSARAA